MTMDWIHEGRPPYSAGDFQIWDGKQVREVTRVMWLGQYPGPLMFKDCTHPLQNIFCGEDKVIAWRPIGVAVP